jgi:hypothetical protein
VELKSMKMEPKAEEEECRPCDVMYGKEQKPEYPWGLNINLDEESLKKLGIADLPAVGGEMMITAKVKVTSTSSVEYDEGSRRTVALQITDMAIGSEAK